MKVIRDLKIAMQCKRLKDYASISRLGARTEGNWPRSLNAGRRVNGQGPSTANVIIMIIRIIISSTLCAVAALAWTDAAFPNS
jgi:hypothetical protein